jgi:hypothetical protein
LATSSFRRCEIAVRNRGHDPCRGSDAVGGGVERRQVENDRLVLSRRHQPVETHAKRRGLARFRQLDRLARNRLGVFRQQIFQQDRCPVARPARPAGGIFRFRPFETAWLKSPFPSRTKIRLAPPRLAGAQQKARRGLPPGRLT